MDEIKLTKLQLLELIQQDLEHSMRMLKLAKGEERSEFARKCAVLNTELEKAYAYFQLYLYSAES